MIVFGTDGMKNSIINYNEAHYTIDYSGYKTQLNIVKLIESMGYNML